MTDPEANPIFLVDQRRTKSAGFSFEFFSAAIQHSDGYEDWYDRMNLFLFGA